MRFDQPWKSPSLVEPGQIAHLWAGLQTCSCAGRAGKSLSRCCCGDTRLEHFGPYRARHVEISRLRLTGDAPHACDARLGAPYRCFVHCLRHGPRDGRTSTSACGHRALHG